MSVTADGVAVSDECAPDLVAAVPLASAPRRRALPEPIDRVILLVGLLAVTAVSGALLHWAALGWSCPAIALVATFSLNLLCELAELPVALGARRLRLTFSDTSLLIGLTVLPIPPLSSSRPSSC